MAENIKNIQRVLIWSSWLRLAHWLMGSAVLLLAATGWLIQMSPSVASAASDFHYIFATLLIGSLVLRAALLFYGKNAGHWKKLLPEKQELQSYKKIFIFYLSLGKMPLPKWYAHNPLWKPIYILVFIVLLMQVLTGMNQNAFPVVLGFYLPSVHEFLASIILGFTALHFVTVVLHDLKGTASDISAMINGYKVFVIQKQEIPESSTVHAVSLDQLKKNR